MKKISDIGNIVRIREELGMTQEDMAEILSVSTQQYKNYEKGNTVIPLIKAIILSKRFNYSIDYIYGLSKKPEKINDEFMVDIREFVDIDKDKNLTVNISESHLDYLLRKSWILGTTKTKQEIKNDIAQLDAEFLFSQNNVMAQFKINHDDFETYVKSEDIKIPFCEGSTISSVKIMENSEEKNKKVKKMFDDIINNKSE